MDASSHNLPGVFRELSRLSDGDHTVYLRTDPHSFFEIHRTGARSLFTSTVAAFIPNVVIKLQTPLAAAIIAAVPSQQGSPTLHARSRLFIVDGLSDTVNFVKHHKAAFIREDATLAVWGNGVQLALASLHQVLKELGVSLGRHDLVRVVDPEGGVDHNVNDAFDEFIHNYDDPVDKPHDGVQAARISLPPLGTLDDVNTLEAMYPISRTNLFDSLSSGSPMLGDSPFLSSAVSTGMSRLCLGNAPRRSPSPTFSPSSLSFDFASPSISSNSSSDSSALSTPLTIAPSVLSSPLSTWNSPQLPTISESFVDETLQGESPVEPTLVTSVYLASPSSPSGSDKEAGIDTSNKRKRSSKAKQAQSSSEAPPKKTRSRRDPRAATAPKTDSSSSPRPRKAVPKAITPASSAPKRTLCPLPGRTIRSRSSSTSSSLSSSLSLSSSRASARSPSSRIVTAAHWTPSRVTHAACCENESESDHEPECELLESDDSGSEYEAESSELEIDELADEDEYDDDYRPMKRTRSLTSSAQAASPGSSITGLVRRKAVSPRVAAEKNASKKKKSASTSGGGSKKKKSKSKAKEAAESGPKPTCMWCDKEFTRESDVARHERYSCKLYPFERAFDYCPLCDKEISRTDAVIRHQGSDDCKKRQRELGLVKAKAAARVTKAAKALLSPRRRRARSSCE